MQLNRRHKGGILLVTLVMFASPSIQSQQPQPATDQKPAQAQQQDSWEYLRKSGQKSVEAWNQQILHILAQQHREVERYLQEHPGESTESALLALPPTKGCEGLQEIAEKLDAEFWDSFRQAADDLGKEPGVRYTNAIWGLYVKNEEPRPRVMLYGCAEYGNPRERGIAINAIRNMHNTEQGRVQAAYDVMREISNNLLEISDHQQELLKDVVSKYNNLLAQAGQYRQTILVVQPQPRIILPTLPEPLRCTGTTINFGGGMSTTNLTCR